MINSGSSLRIAALFLLCFSAWLIGCQPASYNNNQNADQSVATASIAFKQPSFLSSRAIDSSLLRIRVRVNEDTFGLTRNGETWTGEVSLPYGQYARLQIVWLQDELELASYTREISEVTDNLVLNITSDMYDSTQHDWDNDGTTNLAELRGDTDPWDFDSPAINNTTVSTPVPNETDFDLDGVDDVTDNCFSVSNFEQLDTDGDGLGDLCDSVNGVEAASVVPELSENGVIKLNRNVVISDIAPTAIPGAMDVSLSLSFSETQGSEDPVAIELHTKLLTGDSREMLAQISSNTGEMFSAGETITYRTGMFVYGRGGSYQIRVDESAPGAAASAFARMQVADDSTMQNPISFNVAVGHLLLSSPIYIEQSTTATDDPQFELVFSLTEQLGAPISAKVFVNISADNGGEYNFLSNSDSWTDNIGTSIFSANQTRNFRMILSSDEAGAELRPGTYTAQVGAWIYNQINPSRYAAFDFLDINPDSNPIDTADRVSFELQ